MRKNRLWLFFAFLAFSFVFLRPPTDPDLGWHLRYGRIMVEKRQLPRVDGFSHTMGGYPWADSYWLSEVLIFLGWKFLGFLGLSFVFSLLAAGAVFLALAAGKGWEEHFYRLRNLCTLFLSGLLFLPFVGIRPQTISLFFFALLLSLLRRRRLRWLPLLFLFWANFHAGFLLGLLALWFFLLGRMGERMAAIVKRQRSFSGFLSVFEGPLARTASFATLATFINPYGLFLWRTIFKDALSLEIKRRIVEWAAPNFHTDVGLLFILYVLATVALLAPRWRKLHLPEIILTTAFLFLGLAAIRNIPLFVIVVLPLLAKALWALRLPRAPSFYRFWGWLTLGTTALYALFVFGRSFYRGDWGLFETRGVGGYPQKAIEFLKNHHQPGNVFNTYGWGGFLLWNLPEVKTFIDGRMCGWRWGDEESLFSKYTRVVRLRPGWEEVLREYRVDWVIAERKAPLSQALAIDKKWRKLYEDELAVVYRKDKD